MSDPNKTPSNTDDEAERQREKARIDAAKRNLNLDPSKDSGVGQSLAVPDKDTRSSSQFIQSKPSTSKKARLDLDLPNPMPAAITPAAPIDTTTTDTSGTDTTTQPSGSGTPKKRKKTDASKKLKNMVLWRFFETDKTTERDNPHTNLTHRDAVCKVQVIDRFKVQPCGQHLSRSDGTTSAMRKHLRAKHPKTYLALEREEADHLKEQDSGRKELELGMGEIEDFHANRISKFSVTFIELKCSCCNIRKLQILTNLNESLRIFTNLYKSSMSSQLFNIKQ
jgi:hypothetical protein